MQDCTFVFSSVTYALKAQKLLSGYAIASRIIKLDSAKAKNGCAYGLSLQSAQKKNAAHIFDINGLFYSE